MKLLDLLQNVNYDLVKGNLELEINEVQYDSRKVKKGDVYVAREGFPIDTHEYIDAAIENGAIAIVINKDVLIERDITVIKAEDSREALCIMASNFYGNPHKNFKLIGVTGTNGKTTITFIMKAILEAANYKVGVIGTVACFIGDKKLKTNNTTPDATELHKLFYEMSNAGVEYCIMEVSSHALDLKRVHGLEFGTGIFTNLTQDHLDYHETFENYFEAKMKLFRMSKNCIVNIDSEYGEKVVSRILEDKSKKRNIIKYSIDNDSQIKAENLHLGARKSSFEWIKDNKAYTFHVNVPGRYNVYNALACIGTAFVENIGMDKVEEGLNKIQIPGRCELVTREYDLGFDVIVDYAHTPDALENILETAKEFTSGRLISIFGCGGNRDASKRHIMGRIGSEISDIAIVTSDNPRFEEPMLIIEDIIKGIDKDNYVIIENRREAIKEALRIAKKGDTIVIAGKGHEDYQIIKDKKYDFDERVIVKELIKELFGC